MFHIELVPIHIELGVIGYMDDLPSMIGPYWKQTWHFFTVMKKRCYQHTIGPQLTNIIGIL